MPQSFPGPSFGLSRCSAPDAGDWAAYRARVALAAPPMSAEVEASIRANEAILLGRPARAGR